MGPDSVNPPRGDAALPLPCDRTAQGFSWSCLAHVYRRDPRTGELPFGLVEVVRQERLGDVTDEEVARDGFPGWPP